MLLTDIRLYCRLGERNGPRSLLHPMKGKFTPVHCLGSHPRRGNNFSLSVPGVPDIPALTLCPIPLPTRQCCALVFYPRQAGWVLELQTLGTWHSMDPCWSSAEGLPTQGLMHFCPRRAVPPKCMGMDFLVKCSKGPMPRLVAFSRCLCIYAEGLGRVMVSSGFFFLWKCNGTSHRCTPRRENCLSQCVPGNLQIALSAPRLFVLLLHRSTAVSSGLHTSHSVAL